MKTRTILYVGEQTGNSLSRLNAFRRLGYNVTVITPRHYLPKTIWVEKIFWKLSGLPFVYLINKSLVKELSSYTVFDYIWVNAGDYLFPSSIKILKKHTKKIVNYTTDDPFGGRDKLRHLGYLLAIPLYDLTVVVRQVNVKEAYAKGAQKVICTYMTADEIDHCPNKVQGTKKSAQHSADVLFIGTWFPERGSFLAKLVKAGIPLSIAGQNWHKAPEFKVLRKHIISTKGLWGQQYVDAIQNAKICLGLLSKKNRDLHTTRSMEIPYLGGLFCAERTTEHECLYRDGIEAVFWEDVDECITKCKELLQNTKLIEYIGQNGRKRALINNNLNEVMILNVMNNI